VYYHCDFAYVNDAGARDYVQKVSDFQYRHGYNFVREDQMMYASAAARNLDVEAKNELGVLHITPAAVSSEGTLFDEVSQRAMGVEVSFAENVDANAYDTNADVWHREGNSIFMSLDQGVTVSWKGTGNSPLRQVNLPAEITVNENAAEILFLQDGCTLQLRHD
jgi:hypothetical protein